MNRLADPQVRGTAAEIAVHRRVNVGVRRLGMLGQERGGRHELPRLTVPALRHVQLLPGALQRVRSVGREPLDRGDVGPLNPGDRRDAGASRLAAYVNGAGTTLFHAAAEFGALE